MAKKLNAMPIWRMAIFSIAIGAAIILLVMAVWFANSKGGDPNAPVPFYNLFALGCGVIACLFGLVALTMRLWDIVWLRILLLIVVLGALLFIGPPYLIGW